MYNLFEREIQNTIVVPSEVTSENYREKLENIFLIKVSGKSEIEDYERVKLFAKRFNELTAGIAFAKTINEIGINQHQAEALLENTQDKTLKAQLRAYIQKLKNPDKLSKDAGMYQDEQLLSVAQLFTDMFYPEGFDVTIAPVDGAEDVVYRGVLDKRWLRVSPNFLKALYGGYTEFTWTMVGQITHLPGGQLPSVESLIPRTGQETPPGLEVEAEEHKEEKDSEEKEEGGTSETDSSAPAEESPSMRDPFRGIVGALRSFERMFLESKQRVEVVVCPLAIYREIPITIASETREI